MSRFSRPSPNDKSPPAFDPPHTISLPALLERGSDLAFREALYVMALASARLQACREGFGRSLSLTSSQFIVLMGVAHCQGRDGVTIRGLADHTHLASTHVTTEVGRLIDRGLLDKQPSASDRRSVLVRLTATGEAAVGSVAPLMRKVNDQLFRDVSREDFAVVTRVLETVALNSELALAEIRRNERDRTAMKA